MALLSQAPPEPHPTVLARAGKFSALPDDITSVGAGGIGVSSEDLVLRGLDRLPPFSPILNRLMASLAREDVSFRELSDVIEKDTVVAGNLLRLVNSALYGFSGTVNSVRHAVAILGVMKLRNVVMGMSISRMWRTVRTPENWSAARFNIHSAATAILSDLLVEKLPVPYPEGAFVAGLLHDIGKLLIAIALPREFALIQTRFELGGATIGVCELEVIGATHAALSGAALNRWNLPAPIRRAVSFHHHPDQASQGQLELSHVVHAANQLANDLGHSALSPDHEQNRHSDEVLAGLGLTDQVPRLLAQFGPEFETLRSFF